LKLYLNNKIVIKLLIKAESIIIVVKVVLAVIVNGTIIVVESSVCERNVSAFELLNCWMNKEVNRIILELFRGLDKKVIG